MQDSVAHESSPRERRKVELAQRIQRHAVDLALSGGSAAVTVEAICERSAISVRTFYNYFESKDAAVVGEGPTMPSPAVIERFRASTSPDVLSDLLDAVTASFTALDSDEPLQRDRARLMRAEPPLLEAMGSQMGRVRDDLVELVMERLTRDGRDPADLYPQAVLLIELKSAVMKTALHIWRSDTTGTFEDARQAAQQLAARAFPA